VAEAHDGHGVAPGAFWSGIITFGLVSIPVDLYSAHRPKAVSLRLVDRHGTALHRRYFCPTDQQPVDRDELVRGYEIEEGRYIVVEDEELEALAPKKSREIDLRCFVALADLAPVYFQHAYFLLPAGGVDKAYRLLAEIMQRSGRAGIATFVLRAREHVVAIIPAGGLLRAETLLFADEIREPAAVGLPPLEKAPAAKVKRLRQAMKKLRKKEFDPDLVRDRHAHRILELVQRKLAAGEDVATKPAEPAETEGAEIIDLMAIIKERFSQPAPSPRKGGRSEGGRRGG
jgi:DNA end-binding protein Ku